jgi:hypothetical protein
MPYSGKEGRGVYGTYLLYSPLLGKKKRKIN